VEPVRYGPYIVVRKLGEGGMGSVFEVRHETIERRAAIKILRPEYAQTPDAAIRFINEARSVNRVEHPGFIQIYDFVQQPDGVAYIVMEYLGGETVSSRLKKYKAGSYEIGDAVSIGWQIAESLAAVHAKGIIHRDLKPSNVMIIPDPHMPSGERTKVLDFGIAKIADAVSVSNTQSSVVMGTPIYMSPEQCQGAKHVDDRSDVYSLGCMLYEMITGKPPFTAESSAQVLGMHMFRQPPAVSDGRSGIPTVLSELVDRMLLKNRDHRPSMQQVADCLRAIDRSGSSRTLSDQSGTKPSKKRAIKILQYTVYLTSIISFIWIDRTLIRGKRHDSSNEGQCKDARVVGQTQFAAVTPEIHIEHGQPGLVDAGNGRSVTSSDSGSSGEHDQPASAGHAASPLVVVAPSVLRSPTGAAAGSTLNPSASRQGGGLATRRMDRSQKGWRGNGPTTQSSVNPDDLLRPANEPQRLSPKQPFVEAELPLVPSKPGPKPPSPSAMPASLGRIQVVD